MQPLLLQWHSVVCPSVGLSVSPEKMAEMIEVLFGLWVWVGPRKHVLIAGAHWRHLANAIELSMCGSDAAFLSNYGDGAGSTVEENSSVFS